ncbi:NADH dehydrogenase [ubiquinone] 1 beta subcomplex subunit 11, mitochondrial [Latimeria chalumnae]|uniref:NADH dehydrogenase [ubiquinone] 1 beta subcomplex subunit 11, mitochondrial n=1 Tax=Latimeria chalumnae TaxID=7897 RepID=UPI0006D9331D|nr:PREDICTED: NADH dehydrogenase [ubiquinone] 1 beta subcomplex subunit 11, mitochondrial [Latimeria chalumnae]|eukprot:XP_006012050.2 PREDICTED: NADH dehydrogenase [ubiquinone] 1 beta subcomplex subunit 11, mitochondrial [Latimeria chalumnae]
MAALGCSVLLLRRVAAAALFRGPGGAVPLRSVSNSSRTDSSVTAAVPDSELRLREEHPASSLQEHQEVSMYEKNRDYHGFHADPHVDVWNMRLAFFFGISVAIVLGSTFVHYLPDHGMRQWARREAERRIKEKEPKGLVLIDENYYDPNKIILPSSDQEE